jgi:hypothetical protein
MDGTFMKHWLSTVCFISWAFWGFVAPLYGERPNPFADIKYESSQPFVTPFQAKCIIIATVSLYGAIIAAKLERK